MPCVPLSFYRAYQAEDQRKSQVSYLRNEILFAKHTLSVHLFIVKRKQIPILYLHFLVLQFWCWLYLLLNVTKNFLEEGKEVRVTVSNKWALPKKVYKFV